MDKEVCEAERRRLVKVFTDHAFQFLACADTVLANLKLSCVDVPIENGMAYTGALPKPTIGAYVELWTTSPLAAQFNEDGLSLTWFISGSPLSGANACESVWQDGTCRWQSPYGKFLSLAGEYSKASVKYLRLKRETGVVPYTLDEAAEWVEQQLAPETYHKAIDKFAYELMNKQRERAIEEKQAEVNRLNKEIDVWKDLYVNSVLLTKIDLVRQLVEDYRTLEQRVGERIDQLKRNNDALKARFPKRERGCKEFNTLFHRNNKAIERLELQLRCHESSISKQLFPENTPTGLNFPLHYEVEKLCTIDNLTKFLSANP